MNYRQLMHFVIVARDDNEAAEVSKKLDKLLKTPLVRMAIQGEGIQLAHGDGRPVVYAPKREA
jgi:ABC-type metal ion transport system substrate-binding protein